MSFCAVEDILSCVGFRPLIALLNPALHCGKTLKITESKAFNLQKREGILRGERRSTGRGLCESPPERFAHQENPREADECF